MHKNWMDQVFIRKVEVDCDFPGEKKGMHIIPLSETVLTSIASAFRDAFGPVFSAIFIFILNSGPQ